MTTTYIRFNQKLMSSIFSLNNTIVERHDHRIKVRIPLRNLRTLELRDIVLNGADAYTFVGDDVIVNVSLSHLTASELGSYPEKYIKTARWYTEQSGDVFRPTKNRNLYIVQHMDGTETFLTGEFGTHQKLVKEPVSHEFPKSPIVDFSHDSELAEMLKNHDWYYGYSDSLAVYKRGESQRKEILDRLRVLGCFDPDEYYRNYPI